MSVIEASEFRKTIKRYIDKKISEKDLNELLEVARHAPSSMGLEPTRLIVIRNKELKEVLAKEVFSETNYNLVNSADSLLIFTSLKINEIIKEKYLIERWSKLIIDKDKFKKRMNFFNKYVDQIKNTEGDYFCFFQTYISASFLMLAAADKKIGSSFLGGFKSNIDSVLNDMKIIDSNKQRVSICMALGYFDSNDAESFRKSYRISKNEFVTII
ncbi:nitroreductase family protein [Spiroplasma endosymbiont of Amphibalanus improvisus]|uniref:nitroreductase family protein n=1 Tax=Spiroplasma endosymbiont of Amphibalanus improvisus TaxID=3066327 RepID=UPI00313BAD2F